MSSVANSNSLFRMLGASLRAHANAWMRSMPWLVVGVAGYLFMFADVKNMDMNLAYQCYKACWAVILTIVCDNGLNWAVPESSNDAESNKYQLALENGTIGPQIRRAIIFLGLCHLLQIA